MQARPIPPTPPIPELAIVALTADLPEEGLRAGDVGTVVMVHRDGAGYTVEFCDLTGETVAVTALEAAQVRPIEHGEIASARRRAG
jgi:hypothetical protein